MEDLTLLTDVGLKDTYNMLVVPGGLGSPAGKHKFKRKLKFKTGSKGLSGLLVIPEH